MKITKLFVAAVLLSGAGMVSSAWADDDVQTANQFENEKIQYPLFRQQELDLDLFGSSSLGEETLEHISGNRFRHHALYGGGGGLTFFFLKYVGIGGEYEADARASRFVDSASGNVYLRYPIESIGLSPYIFGGGGYQFEDLRQSFAQGGGGLEYRFCHNLGIFADGRWVAANKTKDYALVRAGFRISF